MWRPTVGKNLNHRVFPWRIQKCCQVASVVSNSVGPHRRQPTRLPRPWESPGKITGVGCHFLLQRMKVKSESEVVQSCLILSDPMDCSPPGSSSKSFQARPLEWVASSFSNTWKWKVKVKSLSRVWPSATPWTTAYQAPHPWDSPGKSTGVGCHCQYRNELATNIWNLFKSSRGFPWGWVGPTFPLPHLPDNEHPLCANNSVVRESTWI